MSGTEREADWAEKIGAPAYGSIREMVAALECDYARLAELREGKADYDPSEYEDAAATWAEEFPDQEEQLKELEAAAGECKDQEEARQRIEEDPLSVEVRSGWATPGAELEPEEYCILISTGGPAVRIVGDLDGGEPIRAQLEVQDWGKPWTEYVPADVDVLLAYARCFCFES